MAQPGLQVKLCPHCANSIALEASRCTYCKAELDPAEAHEWPERSARVSEPTRAASTPVGINRRGVAIGIAATTFGVLLMAAFLLVGQRQRGDGTGDTAARTEEVQEKNRKIQALEDELAQLRSGNQGRTEQIDELKAKLDDVQRDLALTTRKLAEANREIDRLASTRAAPITPPARRNADPLPPQQPTAPARRTAEPGVYETRRPTAVFEQPSESARVVTRIDKATIVTVVGSVGDWLEVRSKHGNPPGFIRSEDAMFVRRSN